MERQRQDAIQHGQYPCTSTILCYTQELGINIIHPSVQLKSFPGYSMQKVNVTLSVLSIHLTLFR